MARSATLLGQLRLFAAIVKWRTVIQATRVFGLLRSPRQIISAWPDHPDFGPRIAIFMHFSRNGRVSSLLIFYLRELARNGYSIAFVTNSGQLAPASRRVLEEICAAIFVRKNVGYDFGAWADVIRTLRLPGAETKELLLVNDSMYGPLLPLDTLLNRLDYREADIWGLTDSWQQRYHLQSFFLGFGETALRSTAFGKFWRKVRPVPSKVFIVRAYEVGLTQAMLKAGLRCKAVWPYDALVAEVGNAATLNDIIRAERAKSARSDPVVQMRKLQTTRIRTAVKKQIALNPSADLWRQLLRTGFPFIKRELLRKNPSKVEDIGEWVSAVREFGLDPDPILNELRAGLKNRAP